MSAVHGRHPVAEEDVDVLVLQRGIGHRHRQHLDHLRLVAEGRRGSPRRSPVVAVDVGPADIGEAAPALQLSPASAARAPVETQSSEAEARGERF